MQVILQRSVPHSSSSKRAWFACTHLWAADLHGIHILQRIGNTTDFPTVILSSPLTLPPRGDCSRFDFAAGKNEEVRNCLRRFVEKMLAAYFDCPGGPENLYVKEVMKPHPGEGEVLVKVSASALNRADLLQVCVS